MSQPPASELMKVFQDRQKLHASDSVSIQRLRDLIIQGKNEPAIGEVDANYFANLRICSTERLSLKR